jgi:type I restriction enzyme S subunit
MEVKAGYQQTEAGVIPDDWEVSCVGDSFDVCNQLRLPISQSVRERIAGDYPYYGPTSVQGWINEYRVDGEYALIGEDGDHFLKWRSQPMTLLVRGKFNVNNHAHVVRGSKNLTEWFYWFFANRDITPHLTRQGAGRYKLTKAALLQVPCALPSPPEQQAIAEALNDADAFIESLEQLTAKKRLLKQGAMQELLTGKNRLPGFSGEWKETVLGQLGKCHRGVSYNPSSDLSPFDTEATCRLLRSNNVQEARVVFSDMQYVCSECVSDDQRLRTNDILICMANGSRELVGKAGRFTAHDGFEYTFGSFMGCFRPDGRDADPDFIFYLFQTEKYRAHIAILLAGSSINNLTPGSVEAFSIRVPFEQSEQTAISTILSDMDKEVAALESKLAKARQIKQGMMQELLTGRIRLI